MNRTYAFAHSYVSRSPSPAPLVCISEKAPDDDARAREREGGGVRERKRGRGSSNGYDINTFNVSKTFRDGRTRIDENPILITEPRPVLAARRAASRTRVSIETDFQSLFILLQGRKILDKFDLDYKYHGHSEKTSKVYLIPIFAFLLSK